MGEPGTSARPFAYPVALWQVVLRSHPLSEFPQVMIRGVRECLHCLLCFLSICPLGLNSFFRGAFSPPQVPPVFSEVGCPLDTVGNSQGI